MIRVNPLPVSSYLGLLSRHPLGKSRMAAGVVCTVPPSINDEDASPVNISVNRGQSLIIVCPATGVPAPQVTWYRDDLEVVPDDWSDVRVMSDGRRLEISGVEVHHAGLYRCLAQNSAGHVDRQYTLRVLG